MAIEIDPEGAKKITKLAMAGYMIKFLIAPAQPLPENDKAAIEAMAGGGFIARLKFASLEGRSVRLMPVLANEKPTWQCVSDDVEPSYLPAQCRNAENLRKATAAAAALPTKVKQAK